MYKSAARYAQALFEIADDNNALKLYSVQLDRVAGAFLKSSILKDFLNSKIINPSVKKEVIVKIFQGLNENIINTLLLLADKNRTILINEINSHFKKLADRKMGVINARILSSHPLDRSQVEKIMEKIKKEHNAAGVNADVIIDKGLIGGIKILLDGKQVDYSVKAALKQLMEEVSI